MINPPAFVSACLLLNLRLLYAQNLELPSAQSLGSTWMSMPVRAMPVVTNFVGGATLQRETRPGVGLAGLGPITTTPYDGNFINASLLVDNQALHLGRVEWGVCEAVRHAQNVKMGVRATNRVRMPFEAQAVMQVWNLSGLKANSSLKVSLDGPFFRRCENPPLNSQPCGWGVSLPVDRSNFMRNIIKRAGHTSRVMITTDTLSQASTASMFWCASGCGQERNATIEMVSYEEADEQLNVGGYVAHISAMQPNVELRFIATVADSPALALKDLEAMSSSDDKFESTFLKACSAWEDRWSSGFDPQDLHFSGNLPYMLSNNRDLDRLFYWAALALIALERTNLKADTAPFVISEGPSNSLRGDSDMGGSGQFLWDLSFSATALSLLEPVGTRRLVEFVMRNSKLTSSPIGIPQTWDAYPRNATAGPGQYCFDYVSIFLLVQQYVVSTNDTSLLHNKVPGIETTGLEFLRQVAWAWRAYPRTNASMYLVDYGPDKRSFLEAVPTYRYAIPALQASNAGMMLSFARLLESLGSSAGPGAKEEIRCLRGNATQMLKDLLRYQYKQGEGFWQVIQSGPFQNGTEVRAISDFIYTGMSLGLLGQVPHAFSKDVRNEMLEFFQRELLANGWVRALSLSDPVMRNVESQQPSLEDKLAMRPDWTGTGGYGGLAGFAVEASVSLEQGFDHALEILQNISLVASSQDGSMPAQGVAVMTPPFIAAFLNGNDGLPIPSGPFAPNFPEWFDEGKPFPAWWPSTERSIQNAEASIVDVIVRSIFGWRPDWDTWQSFPNATAAIENSLYLPSVPRHGFEGVLRNVRTPHGRIDIIAGDQGLSWSFSASVPAQMAYI